ncbi:hypothetical protein OSTOST_20863 [Ostertagia ostertagi]
MAAPGKPEHDYGVEMYGFPDFVHVPAKKAHYDTWSTRSSSGCSSSSSPNHLDELHVLLQKQTWHEYTTQRWSRRLLFRLKFLNCQHFPPTRVRHGETASSNSSFQPVLTCEWLDFHYAEFEDAFEAWKKKCLHPFRVASSETLREPDGTVNHRFKYRYVVFHCAHYGEPRMRGIGKRPNQHYLPSGCRAMLRLNYSFSEQLLKITTLHDEHLNHEISAEMFRKVSAKLKRSSIGTPSPANKRQKTESPVSSPYSQESSFCQPSPLTANSPLQGNTPTSGANTLAQIMASLLNQQKENINMASGLSSLGIPRPQPSMINILGMMGLQQRLLLQQPAYGLVAPLTQQVSSPPQAQSVPQMEPKPNAMDREAEQRSLLSRPPPLTVPTSTTTLTASFEESLARLRNGAQDAELMNRIAPAQFAFILLGRSHDP